MTVTFPTTNLNLGFEIRCLGWAQPSSAVQGLVSVCYSITGVHQWGTVFTLRAPLEPWACHHGFSKWCSHTEECAALYQWDRNWHVAKCLQDLLSSRNFSQLQKCKKIWLRQTWPTLPVVHLLFICVYMKSKILWLVLFLLHSIILSFRYSLCAFPKFLPVLCHTCCALCPFTWLNSANVVI